MIANWPTVLAGCLYLWQAFIFWTEGNWQLSGAFLAYAAANVCFSMVE